MYRIEIHIYKLKIFVQWCLPAIKCLCAVECTLKGVEKRIEHSSQNILHSVCVRMDEGVGRWFS